MKTTLQESAAFRALDSAGQIKALRGQTVERHFTVDRAGIDEEKRTCWLSIASDQPYDRWWGTEILDMGKKSIRDQRLKKGLPILVGHDSSDIVGKAEDYELTPDKKLRLLARFGKSARAEEIWQDVLDGIRTDTSVGYIIHDLVLEKQEEGHNTYRVTDWEPLEGSLVSIPADPSVGVGRNHIPSIPPKETIMTEAEIRAAAEQKVRDEIEAKRQADARAEAEAKAAHEANLKAVTLERDRVTAILAAGDAFKDQGGPELARELIKDTKATEDTFKARMFEKQRDAQTVLATAQPADVYGAGARAHIRYAPLKAFRDQVLTNGKTMKAEEAAFRSGQWLAAAVYGRDSAKKFCRDNGINFDGAHSRVMSGNSNALGGAIVPNEMENAIIDLRDSYGVARQLARVRPMASDSLTIPRRTGGLTAYFFNDDDGTGITASDKSWDDVTLNAKKLGVLARVSEDLVEDAIINVVDDLAQESAYAFAKKEDECLIDGDGASTYGGMQGLRPRFVATAYSSRITLAAGHDLFTEVDATDLANVMGGLAAYAAIGAKWLCSRTFKAVVFDRLKAAAGGNRVDTLGMATGDEYLGYPIITSEVMPAGAATDYTDLVMAMFGRFDLAVSFGSRRGITVKVLQERYAELGQIGVVVTERIDIVPHDLGSTTVKGPIAAAYGGT